MPCPNWHASALGNHHIADGIAAYPPEPMYWKYYSPDCMLQGKEMKMYQDIVGQLSPPQLATCTVAKRC